MRYAVTCDHGGFSIRELVCDVVRELGHEVEDFGCFSEESVDYPDYAELACDWVLDDECQRAILICGSGIGMSMAANRHRGIRAALCASVETAVLTRQHNDANVLCLGARTTDMSMIRDIVRAVDSTEFEGGRHQRRIDKF